MTETLDTKTIKKFFDTASGMQFRTVMSVLDKMQDDQDHKLGKHVPIQLTVAIFAEAIHRSEVILQRRMVER